MNRTLLPVTVLSGFLGAGKTTTLRHILQADHGFRVAVIVNDMSELNVDARLVQNTITVERTEAKLVEMSNGCICCTLREDLLQEVSRLAREGRFDYLLIESTGISEPLPVAQTFVFEDEHGESLSSLARLDTLVTVVDGPAILTDIQNGGLLADRGESLGEDDDRNLSDLLVDQIEFANVILLNKTDRMETAQIERVREVIRHLNPVARIFETQHGQVHPLDILQTGLFDMETAQASAGWQKELAGEHTPESEEYGISSFVYRARAPFHPTRLWNFLQSEWKGVIRSKGFFWISSRPAVAFAWSLAGGARSLNPAGYWWSALSAEQRREMGAPDNAGDLHEVYGDRMQELVFIGIDMNPAAITEGLDLCLLTEAEGALKPKMWTKHADPLPVFDADDQVDA